MQYQFRLLAVAAAASVIQLAATPAHAVITTFATFNAIDGANLRWTNSDGASNTGSGGSFSTTSSHNSLVIGSRNVNFSFLNVGIAPDVSNVTAVMRLNASAPTGNPALQFGPTFLQDGIAGSFSFITTSGFSIGSVFFAAGSNLLSGSFGGGAIVGSGSGGSLNAQTPDAIVFTSDFLDFGAVTGKDISLSLAGISPALARLNGSTALSGFTATGGGTFSSDGAPELAYPPTAGVPEPSTWGLMMLGFGVLGARLRRRRSGVIAV